MVMFSTRMLGVAEDILIEAKELQAQAVFHLENAEVKHREALKNYKSSEAEYLEVLKEYDQIRDEVTALTCLEGAAYGYNEAATAYASTIGE